MAEIPQVQAVEIVPEYPGMIRITTLDGALWHYLPDRHGVLEMGYPVICFHEATRHRVCLFVPLAPGRVPRVLKVESLD